MTALLDTGRFYFLGNKNCDVIWCQRVAIPIFKMANAGTSLPGEEVKLV